MSWTDFHPIVQEATLTTFAVGVLVLFVLIIRKPFARRFGAKAAYLLWALPLARFVTPPLPGNWSLAGALGFNRTTAGTPALDSELAAPAMDHAVPSQSIEIGPNTHTVTVQPDIMVHSAPHAGNSLLEATLAQAPLILTSVWIVGVVLWLATSVYQQRQFLTLIHADSEPADAETIAETERIAKQLGLKRVPQVRTSLLCSGPLVTGLKNPIVLLPMWFNEDYEAAERRDALVHELMHLKRRDLWAFQMARIIAATQWFNPLAHIALKAFRTDQEAACDADVIRRAKLSPAAYGRTLVKAARLARPSDRRIAAASLTLAHPIKERLLMMTHPAPSFRSRLIGGSLAIVLGASAVFITASCTSSVAQELEGGPSDAPRAEQALQSPEAPSEHHVMVESRQDMSVSITVDGETFAFDMADLPPMPPMPEMPPMAGLVFQQDGKHFHMEVDTEQLGALEDSPELAEWEAKMEAWGEEMEAWGAQVEARAEDWAVHVEPRIEAWAEAQAERIEQQVELMAERSEAQAERAEAAMERAQVRVEAETAGGVTAPETRDFGTQPFTKVDVGSGISMIYTQDPNASVTARLDRGSWDQVEVKVKGNTLIARKKHGSNWGYRSPQLTVYAASPTLTSIDAGSGSQFQGELVADDLQVDVSSGSSVSLEGACTRVDIDASSGSSLSLDKLECTDVLVDASSGSSVQVYASNSVDLDASSGSSIAVSGGPSDVKQDTSSGASVRIR
ncbi:MAG: M56 family metallopeptidase [Pseudomonadota bacterium]